MIGQIKEPQLSWLAGLLEGEGSFMKGPPSEPNRIRVVVAMTDEDVVRRAASLVGEGSILEGRRDPRSTKWKKYYILRVRGKRAADLMTQLRPLMGERRRAQIDRALASFVPNQQGRRHARLTELQIPRIRKKLEEGETIAAIAREYEVSRTTILRIQRNEAWKISLGDPTSPHE